MSLINKKFDNKNVHRFTHHAMATIFEIVIQSEDKEYAEQAASAAFAEIDRLEEELSRFRPNSDITRINTMVVGEELRLSHDTFECLVAAKELFELTNGLFDITSGKIIDHWKYNEPERFDDFAPKIIGMNHIILDDSRHSINVLSNDLIIDLGGFGKGYAIDIACELLTDWDITNALIHSGGSTVKTIGMLDGHDGWPISISNPRNPSQTIAEVILKDFSLSGSGEQKGTHIINPTTSLPAKNNAGAWSMTESAAKSDAMSTTFMIMRIEDITEFCDNHEFVSGMVVINNTQNLCKDDVVISNNCKIKNLIT
jgi:FAD:protein FMN transferase